MVSKFQKSNFPKLKNRKIKKIRNKNPLNKTVEILLIIKRDILNSKTILMMVVIITPCKQYACLEKPCRRFCSGLYFHIS